MDVFVFDGGESLRRLGKSCGEGGEGLYRVVMVQSGGHLVECTDEFDSLD